MSLTPQAVPGNTPTAARTFAWPVCRTPRWLLAGAAAFIAAAVLVGLTHRPTTSQRAADLHGLIRTLNADIESCAGGVAESFTALRAIQTGASRDRATAISIAGQSAANCSPANNQLLADLIQYQVPESLARFGLPATVSDLVTWAFPWAQRVAHDIAGVLSARDAAARSRMAAALQADRRHLDALRDRVDGALLAAARSLRSTARPPKLPG